MFSYEINISSFNSSFFYFNQFQQNQFKIYFLLPVIAIVIVLINKLEFYYYSSSLKYLKKILTLVPQFLLFRKRHYFYHLEGKEVYAKEEILS